jgi:hypothetical protein
MRSLIHISDRPIYRPIIDNIICRYLRFLRRFLRFSGMIYRQFNKCWFFLNWDIVTFVMIIVSFLWCTLRDALPGNPDPHLESCRVWQRVMKIAQLEGRHQAYIWKYHWITHIG